jgi:hypothetical protein
MAKKKEKKEICLQFRKKYHTKNVCLKFLWQIPKRWEQIVIILANTFP